MSECYCTECDWEGSWDDVIISNEGDRCPECNSLNLEEIEDNFDGFDDDYYDDDDDDDEEEDW